jgi:CheY-like chemotaxis protein
MIIRNKTRILIIDDDERDRSDLEAMLRNEGYQVLTPKGTGQELINHVSKEELKFRPHVTTLYSLFWLSHQYNNTCF